MLFVLFFLRAHGLSPRYISGQQRLVCRAEIQNALLPCDSSCLLCNWWNPLEYTAAKSSALVNKKINEEDVLNELETWPLVLQSQRFLLNCF